MKRWDVVSTCKVLGHGLANWSDIYLPITGLVPLNHAIPCNMEHLESQIKIEH